MMARANVIVGPGVRTDDKYSHEGLNVAFEGQEDFDTDVVLYELFQEGTDEVRDDLPEDAILALVGTGKDKAIGDWARSRSAHGSPEDAVGYYSRIADEAATEYNTMWLPGKSGLDCLLSIYREFKVYGVPLDRLVSPGVNYDFVGNELRVCVGAIAWVGLVNSIAGSLDHEGDAGAEYVRSTAGSLCPVTMSLAAYADLLHMASSPGKVKKLRPGL